MAALLSPDGIPAPVFATRAVQALLSERRGRPVNADRAWQGLSNLKLLSVCGLDDDRRTVRVHQLVQRAVREAWPGRREQTAVCAADALLEAWPDVERDLMLVDLLRTNTEALCRNSGDALWHGGLHQVVFRAGNSLTLRGLPSAALAYWKALLPAAVDRLGPHHPDTLTIRNNLAWARSRTGSSDRALTDMRELLTVRRRVLGADHPNTLATEHGIADFQAETGDVDGAIEILRRLVAGYERVLGPDERDTLNTRLSLVRLLASSQAPAEAVAHLRELLADYVHVLGPGWPETLDVEFSLAGALVAADEFSEARSTTERLVGEYTRVLGPDHVDTLRARFCAADLHGRDGRRKQAAGEMRELLDDVQRLLQLGRREAEEIREWIRQWSGDEDQPE
ncbi:tetratricopeptide repeat protein [Actinoplanes sp. NPDC051343]|uniref:tetratricopeptide repeat protein n=1 Tax=Actinoplanes sp. NPDC051343 TaxID=3363906 RepID=UPI00378CE138